MLYVVAPFESENICKGISSRNIELIKSFGSKGAKLLLSTFDHRYKRMNPKESISKELLDLNISFDFIFTISYKKNISVLRVVSNLVFSINLFIYLMKNAKSDDIIYINSIPPEVLFVCSILRRIKKIKLIVDVRDIWPDALININSEKSLTLRVFEKYCNFIYSHSHSVIDKIFYVAPSFKGWIERNSPKGIDKVYFPLGFDEKRWDLSNNNEAELIVNSEFINVVYVGYLSHQFDLENVIIAVSKISNVKLHIVGGGDNYNYYTSKYSNLSSVEFYGMVKPRWISKNISQFDVAFLPLKSGGGALLPNKFFDYVAGELPIIAFGSPDVESIIYEYNIGWNVSNDVENICTLFSSLDDDSIDEKKINIGKYKNGNSMQQLNASVVKHLKF